MLPELIILEASHVLFSLPMDYEILKQKLIVYLVTTSEYCTMPTSDLSQIIKIHSLGCDQYISVDEEILPLLVTGWRITSTIRRTRTAGKAITCGPVRKCNKMGIG